MAKVGKNKNAKNKAKHNRLLAQKTNKKKTEQEANKKRLKEIMNKAKAQKETPTSDTQS
jgi:hypothetical protein